MEVSLKNKNRGNALVVPGLGLHASTVGSLGLIPGRRTKLQGRYMYLQAVPASCRERPKTKTRVTV